MPPAIDKLLFVAASNIPGREERRVFLEYACRGDEARLKLLEEMLEIQRDADEFFQLPPKNQVQEDDAEDDGSNGEIGARIGPYRLIDRLGSGGCGVVYLAEQLTPVKRKVALKIIRLGMDTEHVIERFSMEREALALMDHPNIARVLDAGATASGRPYFVMELVDGEKITDYCDRCRLSLKRRLELFILVCEAIQHAHQKGVIHRDIKPSNIIVSEHDDKAVPKIIDFGIAKATAGGTDGTVTRSGQFIGTPAYMSPEQAAGGSDIDTRSDIYSLGVLLYELLTGSTPVKPELLKDRAPDEIRHILQDEETGMPSKRLRQITQSEVAAIAGQRGTDAQRLPSMLAGDLDWIVMKTIEKDRQLRYETANGLAMDVQRYLNEEPVLARPPSRMYRFNKLVRRNRIVFMASGVALFGLLGGLGTSTWLFFREREAREEQARLRVVAEVARANEVRLREDAEAADKAAQAAVHLRYNEREAADRLVDTISAEHVPRSLESANTFMALANWNLMRNSWKEAAERFNLLARVLTSVDMTDTNRISQDFLPTLTAVCEWGEPGQYEELRALAIKRFANSANSIVAEQVIKATLLKPADTETLERILPLSKLIEDSSNVPGQNPADKAHMEAWRQFSLALIAYRQGHLESAGKWARQSLSTATRSPSRATSNQIILAMLDLKKGRIREARATLADSRYQVSRWEAEPFRINTSEGMLWSNWGIARILLREAEAMMAEVKD